MIGFAPRRGFRKNDYNFFAHGWFMGVATGRLYAQGGTLYKVYGGRIPVGSIVTLIHDTRQRTIEFQVDGKSRGIAFRNIPQDRQLFAAADLYGEAAIRIMDNA